VIAELDDNGNMTTSREYDVYGAPRANTYQGATATSSQGYVGSLGHVTDPSTGGLIYMQARYYDPGMGRFVNQDPKGDGNNWYTYCDNQPTNEVDQSGESPIIIAAIVIAAIVGGIMECLNHGWSINNFFLGAGEAAATTAAGIFGGVLGGIIVGAIMGCVDAGFNGGNMVVGAALGGLCGSIGGLQGDAQTIGRF
jgi:RHS repeat-associated protein